MYSYFLSVVGSQPSQDMYQGVLRDEQRRKEKMKQREEELRVSQRKREIYERIQTVVSSEVSDEPSR